MNKQKILVAITGASGSIYAKMLIESLLCYSEQIQELGLIISKTGKDIWIDETGNAPLPDIPLYGVHDFSAPFASGSGVFDTLIICPCSMGSLGRIANGVSDNLITRAADVVLKERKKLILVPRETPLNLIHLRNMTQITEAGGIIVPASPSFYSHPRSIEEAVRTVVERILQLSGLEGKRYQWGMD